MKQTDEIRQYLKKHGSITAREAFLELGIQRLASRIADLRNLGVPITRKIETGMNRHGEKSHWARYFLEDRE